MTGRRSEPIIAGVQAASGTCSGTCAVPATPWRAGFSQIMDNLIAEKKAEPMLIVMARGYALKPGEEPMRMRRPRSGNAGPPDFSRMFSTLEEVFINDGQRSREKPWFFAASPGRSGVGRMTVMVHRLNRTNLARCFGCERNFLSGGSIDPTNTEHVAALKDKAKLVFISYGSRELENRNRRGGDPKDNVEGLKQAGIHAVFYVSPGTAHEWHTWRRSLHEFAPLVFEE